MALDGAGNLYVADDGNREIRMLSAQGVVTTLAGKRDDSRVVDGEGGAARFASVSGIAVDGGGNLYVADSRTIRKVARAGAGWQVTTLAGSSTAWGEPADGIGAAARFYEPVGVAVDSAGALYVADTVALRKMTDTGDGWSVTTLSDIAAQSVAAGADGTLYVGADGAVWQLSFNGTAWTETLVADGSVSFGTPSGLAADDAGNLYVADTGNHCIRRVSPAGAVTTIAGYAVDEDWFEWGYADGDGETALFFSPSGIAADGAGNLYVADTGNDCIRKLSPTGAAWTVSTLAGSAGAAGFTDGTGAAARFNRPMGVAVDGADNVYVVDDNSALRKVTPAGVVTTLADGDDGLVTPCGVTVDGAGNLFIADWCANAIWKATPAGGRWVVTRFASGYWGSGPLAVGSGSGAAHNLAVDGNGYVYVAGSFCHTIRRISPSGTITVIGGKLDVEGNADGIGEEARFYNPCGVALTRDGRLFVADRNRIVQGVPFGTAATPAAQSITFGALSDKQLGDADFGPGATASSGLPVTYTSSDASVAVIVGDRVRLVGVGVTVITATQPGNAAYAAAAPVAQALRVTAAPAVATGATVGSAFEMALPAAFANAARVTVKGLPSKLRFNAATRKIAGVPSKAGTFAVTVTADGVAHAIELTVAALPAWAQGTFTGYAAGGGTATLTVSAAGKASGKISRVGTTYAFKAASYAPGGSPAEGFVIAADAKAGGAVLPVTLRVAPTSQEALGVVSGRLDTVAEVALWRNAWGTLPAALAPYIGYYTATVPGGADYGSGYLTLTVSGTGKVKVAGKLADGTKVSQSGTLILDENGRVFAVVFSAPTAYQGGFFFGAAAFTSPGAGAVCLRPLEDVPFLWTSLNPQATATYGAGFARATGLAGGWYSKTDDLGVYFRGDALVFAPAPHAVAPALTAGAARYESAWWNPAGMALTLVRSAGRVTGLAAPAAGKPADPEKDGTWDYGATENTLGLKITLARATGLLKGSFKIWFEVPPQKQVAKTVAFAGVLTPVTADADGAAGRGYYLWSDKALLPGSSQPYPLKRSYDLILLRQ